MGGRNAENEGGTHHSACSHADGLDGKNSTAHLEQPFKIGPQRVDDEDVMQILLTKVVNLRDTGYFRARATVDQKPPSMGGSTVLTTTSENIVRKTLSFQRGEFGILGFLCGGWVRVAT